MDFYGMSASGHDIFVVDELLDFSNDHDDMPSTTATDMLHQSSSAAVAAAAAGSHFQYAGFGNGNNVNSNYHHHHHSTDFTDHICVPSDDVAELEWLSNFVDDSFRDFPANNLTGTINFRPQNTPFHSRSRSKRTRAPSSNTSWTSNTTPISGETKAYSSSASSSSDTTSEAGVVRRCTHCSSEKTPQWRTGPLGPKTLCNACGVRYKSGRLVPEYRPAASPTFVLTQHSNSHRKVMELRRQKEMASDQQQQHIPSSDHHLYGGEHHHRHRQHHHNNFEVC